MCVRRLRLAGYAGIWNSVYLEPPLQGHGQLDQLHSCTSVRVSCSLHSMSKLLYCHMHYICYYCVCVTSQISKTYLIVMQTVLIVYYIIFLSCNFSCITKNHQCLWTTYIYPVRFPKESCSIYIAVNTLH
uniref:Uncharacterized protein n=1 Tax=Pyxicephalus adspersus TaxID=30357 RepID=A0AAV3A808_PYXAD|nr:TPA: hypothetical protein GDO54_014638 [Pyxicephalus adspersus]